MKENEQETQKVFESIAVFLSESGYYEEKKSLLEGTVIEILSDPLCKDGNVRLTTVPLKAFNEQV